MKEKEKEEKKKKKEEIWTTRETSIAAMRMKRVNTYLKRWAKKKGGLMYSDTAENKWFQLPLLPKHDRDGRYTSMVVLPRDEMDGRNERSVALVLTITLLLIRRSA